MDTTPVYELRERLRAAAIAGTNLLSEDFRLKRAFEAFKPLETVSPVFAKVGQLAKGLLSPDCPNQQGALLDAISLVDAVVCTLGGVDVNGEIESISTVPIGENTDSVIVNAPYSVLRELMDGLAATGSGTYRIRKSNPELFRDYRVKYGLVQALGASYAEFANEVKQWMIEDKDKTILPLLYKDFDPKGKKEMVRRIDIIDALAGAEANDFYIKMLDAAQKEVRQALIFALRHEQKNVSLLFDMSKTEKGKNKDAVFAALANMEDESVKTYFRDIAKKKPETILKYLTDAKSVWAAEVVAEICDSVLERFDRLEDASDAEKEELEVFYLLYYTIRALFGKGGTCICRCYRKLTERKVKITALIKKREKQSDPDVKIQWRWYEVLRNLANFHSLYEIKNFQSILGSFLMQSLVVNPDSDIQALVEELYRSDIYFLPAAVMVKLLNDEDCADWLEEQVIEKSMTPARVSDKRMRMVNEALGFVMWEKEKGAYEIFGSGNASDYPSVSKMIKLSHANGIIHWLMRHPSSDTDAVLAHWAPLNNEAVCKEIGAYFYKKALHSGDSRHHLLDYMRACNWTSCKGLGIKKVRENPNIDAKDLYWQLTRMPGDKDAILDEMRSICDLVKSGELKANRLKTDELEGYMENWAGR